MVYVITSIDRQGNQRQYEASNLDAARNLIASLRMSGYSAWAQIVRAETNDNT